MKIYPLIFAASRLPERLSKSRGKDPIIEREIGYGEFELLWRHHPRGLLSEAVISPGSGDYELDYLISLNSAAAIQSKIFDRVLVAVPA
jgi:hypothetical protein